jgi:predicted dehydrogenase
MVDIMLSLNAGAEITAIADIQVERTADKLKDKGLTASLYANADEMLDKEGLDAVMVGTRCSLHSEMAVKVLNRNLDLFLEKPIATTMPDLIALKEAGERSKGEVVVSLPLRVTPLVRLAKEIVDSGTIGTVEHVQAYNNVPYGSVYFQYWYRDENETGGLFLQKAVHDFDYLNYLIGLQPTQVCAMVSKQIFKGEHKAGLRCEDCEERKTCCESPFNPHLVHGLGDEYARNAHLQCAFAPDTGNEDSGSALVRYENGMHAAYSQNFFVRKKAAKRGATLLGYKGTLEFDWYTDELRVYMHHTPRVDTHKIDSAVLAHGGGDLVLMDNFLQVIEDRAESVSPLSAGLISNLICLKARESAATNSFQSIMWA